MHDEKRRGARGWLRTIAGGVRELTEIGMESLASRVEGEVQTAVERFKDEVRVDLPARRLGLSDRMVERIVREGADGLDDFELLAFVWREGAYAVQARVQSRTVTINVMPQSGWWSAHEAEVRATTPTSPTLEDVPVVNWFVARFVELFGGTSFAASVFARKMPEGLRWDGREVCWKRPLDLGMTGLQSVLSEGVKVKATFAHEDEWLWITFDGSPPSVLVIVKLMLNRLGVRRGR